jgi:hypothetical protein
LRSGGTWREANLDGTLEAEQAQFGRATDDDFSLVFLSPGVSIAGRWRLDADIGQRGRPRPRATPTPDDSAFHSVSSSQHGKRPSSTSLHPIHRATAKQTPPKALPTRTSTRYAVLYSPPHRRSSCHSRLPCSHDIPIHETHMSDSSPPLFNTARTQHGRQI